MRNKNLICKSLPCLFMFLGCLSVSAENDDDKIGEKTIWVSRPRRSPAQQIVYLSYSNGALMVRYNMPLSNVQINVYKDGLVVSSIEELNVTVGDTSVLFLNNVGDGSACLVEIVVDGATALVEEL